LHPKYLLPLPLGESNCSGFGQTVNIARQVLSHGLGVPKGCRAVQYLPKTQYNNQFKAYKGWGEGENASMIYLVTSPPTLTLPRKRGRGLLG